MVGSDDVAIDPVGRSAAQAAAAVCWAVDGVAFGSQIAPFVAPDRPAGAGVATARNRDRRRRTTGRDRPPRARSVGTGRVGPGLDPAA